MDFLVVLVGGEGAGRPALLAGSCRFLDSRASGERRDDQARDWNRTQCLHSFLPWWLATNQRPAATLQFPAVPPHSVAPASCNFGVSSVGLRNRASIRRMTSETADFFGMVLTCVSRHGCFFLDLDAGRAFSRRRAGVLDLPRPTTHKTVLRAGPLAPELLRHGFTDYGLPGRRMSPGRPRTSSVPPSTGLLPATDSYAIMKLTYYKYLI